MSAPFMICVILYVLQEVINNQLDNRSFRCGCKCLSCCDWVPVRGQGGAVEYIQQCYNATDEQPCSPYATCNLYNDTECGYLFSTADQVGFCEVIEPATWPPLLQVPKQEYRDLKYPEVQPEYIPNQNVDPGVAPLLFTGQNPEYAQRLMNSLWARGMSITDAVTQAYLRAQVQYTV